MRAWWIGLSLDIIVLGSPAIAQLPPSLSEGFGGHPGQDTPNPPPTKFARLNQSMEQLLNEGYDIRTGGMGVLFLGKQSGLKTQWVMCAFDVATGLIEGAPGNYPLPTVPCFALN